MATTDFFGGFKSTVRYKYNEKQRIVSQSRILNNSPVI